MNIRSVEPALYRIGRMGHPNLHQNLAWYAVDNDAVLGVVILDLIDHDYSWVAMIENEDEQYTCADMGASYRTQEEATHALHKAMLEMWEG